VNKEKNKGGRGENKGGRGENKGGRGENKGGRGENNGRGENKGGRGKIEGGRGENKGGKKSKRESFFNLSPSIFRLYFPVFIFRLFHQGYKNGDQFFGFLDKVG